MTLFLIFQSVAPAPPVTVPERFPAILTLIYLAGLTLIAVFLLTSAIVGLISLAILGIISYFRAGGFTALLQKLAETVESFEAIVKGELDDVPEQAFLNVGAVEQVLAKAKTLHEGTAG